MDVCWQNISYSRQTGQTAGIENQYFRNRKFQSFYEMLGWVVVHKDTEGVFQKVLETLWIYSSENPERYRRSTEKRRKEEGSMECW